MKPKRILSITMALLLALTLLPAFTIGSQAAPGVPKLVTTAFHTEQLVIADFDVSEIVLGGVTVDDTGVEDAAPFIQAAIDACAAQGGGTVWLPAGRYRVTRGIDVRNFVALCGDWRSPELVGDGDYGTLIIADVPSSDAKYPGLFRLHGSSGCMGLTVWYPNQSLTNVKPYPYTFEYPGRAGDGERDYMMATVKNCTLLNSYRGIGASLQNVDGVWGHIHDNIHEMMDVVNIYGTVLETGLSIHDSADVDVVEFVRFDNKYWAGAGPDFNAPSLAALDRYTLMNTVGFEMSSLDWVMFAGLYARSYWKGLRLIRTKRSANDVAFAYSQLLDCATAISPEETQLGEPYSVLFTRGKIEGQCAAVGKSPGNASVKLVDCEITGATNGAAVSNDGKSPAVLAHQPWNEHKPARAALYNAAAAPYDAPRTLFDALPALDATSAIQQALDDAGTAGGGLVYLPAGWYRVDGNLTVPAGVELRGSMPVPSRDNHHSSAGTALMAYGGRGTETPLTDTALITLDGDGAGLSGLRVLYPENHFTPPESYPFTIRGQGTGIYVINVCLVNCDRGLDLPDAPGHYIRRLIGLAWHGMIRVGTGSGKIEACLGNATFLTRHAYNVPGWPDEGRDLSGIFNSYLRPNEIFIEIDGAVDERMMNVFMFGGKTTISMLGGSALAVNAGSDHIGGPPFAAVDGSSLEIVNMMYYWPAAVPEIPNVAFYNYHMRGGYHDLKPSFWQQVLDVLGTIWYYVSWPFRVLWDMFGRLGDIKLA